MNQVMIKDVINNEKDANFILMNRLFIMISIPLIMG